MLSYNKNSLNALANEQGFIRDNFEKVLRLIEILRYFHNSALLSKSLVLKGGTAINLTIFEMPRLSVDIDLDYAINCSREEMLSGREFVNDEVLRYMTSEGYRLSPSTKNPHSLDSWVFFYTNAAGNNDSIKIEINYSNRCHVLPLVDASVSIPFLSDVTVRTLSPIELFATKINALINRCAARDLYDVYGMIQSDLFACKEERDLLRKTLVLYLTVGSSVTVGECSTRYDTFPLIEGIAFKQIREQLLPVLRKKENFDFESAKAEVIQYLLQLLALTDDEQAYITAFNEKHYKPELLFDDVDIVERISTHPMALWKMKL